MFPPVFKRRRSEEEADLVAAREIRAVGPTADNGLDLPPFRPSQGPANLAAPEETSMARPPQSPSPSPSMNPPMPASAALRPAGARAPHLARETVERRTLVVGRGISLQGLVQDAERLVVEGMVEATMIHAAELSVAPGGVFKGEVEVEDCEISGTVDGTVTVRGNLVVRATGVILGVARCRRLQVEDGGQITGRIEMLTTPDRTARAPEG